MDKNVLIPTSLFARMRELLQIWDVSEYAPEVRDEYDDVVTALELKSRKLELRDAYKKIVSAKDEDSRDWARIEYLREKEQLRMENAALD